MAPNPDGPVDRTVTALIMEGERTAVVWHYTCHPTGFPGDLEISADYPGMAPERLAAAIWRGHHRDFPAGIRRLYPPVKCSVARRSDSAPAHDGARPALS